MRSTKIYGLIDPRDGQLRYIGKCSQRRLSDRINTHLAHARRGLLTHCARWLRGLVADAQRPDIIILEVVQGDVWIEAEQFWIAYFRSIGSRLTNATAGGEGLTGMRHSKESIEKTASAHRGAKRSAEARARMRAGWTEEARAAVSAAVRSRQYSEETRAKMSAAAKKKIITAEHRANIGAASRGRKLTDEHKRKVGEGIAKAWTPERRAAQAERMREARKHWRNVKARL